MKTRMQITTCMAVLLAMSLSVGAQSGSGDKAQAFEAILKKAQRDSANLTTEELTNLLQISKELRRPQSAALAVKAYLSNRQNVPPELMRLAAENAQLVGDFRTATARYKQYLKTASPGPEASDAAAALYQMLIDYMGAGGDAFQFMDEYGEKFRDSVRARKFDSWFVAFARDQRSYASMAKRLAAVFASPLPIEQERLYYWDAMDWLMTDISQARPEQYGALPFCKQLASLIRDDALRTARYNFYVANLAFKAGSAGKEPAALDKEYAAVIAAGRSYFDAFPTTDSLKDIFSVFVGGGGRFDENELNRAIAQKSDFFKYAFAKLNDADKEKLMSWNWNNINNRITTPAQWVELGAQFPDLFKRAKATTGIQFIPVADSPELYKKMTTFLQGVPSQNAAVINSMASSDDLLACAQNLIQKESWYLAATDIHTLFYSQMCPAYNNFKRDEAHKLAPNYLENCQRRFGSEIVFKSPLALFHPDSAREHVLMAWRNKGQDPNDKSQVIAQLHLLDWVPYTAEQRKTVFTPAYDEFKRWAEEVRKSFDDSKKGQDGNTKALETAKKARAETGKLQDETTKALETTKQAIATTTKNKSDAEAALKAAKDAKDAAKTTENEKKIAECAKGLADLANKQPALEKALQDLTAKAQQQDASIQELTQKTEKEGGPLKDLQARIALITDIEAAFKQVLDPKIADPTKAPDPLCQNLAKAVQAIQAKDMNAYVTAAKAIYPVVRDYSVKKTPFGEAILIFLVQNRADVFDTIDFQCDVLADQLSMLDPSTGLRSLSTAIGTIMTGRPGWDWWQIPANDKNRALKLNNVLANTLLAMFEKNQFAPEVFEWFRATRRGNGWQDGAANANVVAKMIQKNLLQNSTWRPWGPTAMANYCYLIRNDFQSLAKDYPIEKCFDDMYVTEVTKTRIADLNFWSYSQDLQKKGYNLTAQMFQDYAKLPLGYGTNKAPYTAAQFWDLHYRALYADDASRSAMLSKIESYFGQGRYDDYAQGRFSLSSYTDLSTPEKRKPFFAKLEAYLDRDDTLPVRVNPPVLPALDSLGKATGLSANELTVLEKILTHCAPRQWPAGAYMETVGALVHEGLVAQKRTGELFAMAPVLWKISRDTGNAAFQRQIAQYAASLMEAGEFDLSATYSSVGVDLMGSGIPEDVRTTLLAVRSKSLSTVGGIIPVDRSDPRYPIFAAQADYLGGKFDNAWEMYLGRKSLLLSEFKELDPGFSTWILQKHTEVGNYDEAESLAQRLIQWVESAPQGFDPEARAQLLVSYADIAFTRQEFPRARAQYERIAVAKEFDGTVAKKKAELKIAEVDRLTKNYDRAIEQLERLTRRKDAYLQAEANYQLALIKYDLEEYPEARGFLDQVFAVDLNHANARILEGKLYLKMKKLVEATEVKVGLSAGQQTIMPGRPLKVQLQDRNLAIVGRSSEIEIRVWTDSGDEEFFHLLPFGDSKTKFEGQIPTTMGKLIKGDHVLQVFGGDNVHYDFSDKFKKANKITESTAPSIAVVSDAELYVSSGKILSKEEQEQRALEQLIRQRTRSEDTTAIGVALSTVRADNEVKPGNKINVRIVDLDENLSTNKDTIKVKVTSASGDAIEGFPLQETAPYSGIFEGQIPTLSAPATAYASDSEEGKDPNQAISSGNYAGWVGLADNIRPKTFSIDLNANVALGTMNIVADVPGRHLKKFILQTSINGREFVNAGAWPIQLPGWDGALRMELVRYAGANGVPKTLSDLQYYLNVGHAARGLEKLLMQPAPLSIKWDATVGGFADKMGLTSQGVDSWYIAHLTGAFYMSKRQVRTFKLDHKKQLANIKYYLTVDGQEGKEAANPYEITASLGKGVHRIDVYLCAQRNASPTFELMNDTPKAPYIAACSPDLFDIVKNPEIMPAIRFQPSAIKTNDGANAFTVTFQSNTCARVLRLAILDFETDAPAIKKITLQDANGQTILPTSQDLMTLKRNLSIEIVPGDKISITYDDPKFVTKERQIIEASMMATFHDASLSACFVESTLDGSGNRIPQYIPMRRFKPDDTVNVFISDPDEDSSDATDKVTFTARTSEGKPVTLDAVETGPHSGIFLGKVFPISVAPQRPSELTVVKGDDLILSYMDRENTDPGIPWNRNYLVEQTSDRVPELRIYDITSLPLSSNEQAAVINPVDVRQYEENVPVTRTIVENRPMEANRETPATGLMGIPMVVELTYPTIMQSPLSRASIYVQTSSGRKKYGKPLEGKFDLNVPGTVKLTRTPGDLERIPPPPGYRDILVRGNPYASNPLEDGRFCFLMPVKLDAIPDKTLAFDSEANKLAQNTRTDSLPTLSIRGGDEIFVGFQYTDEAGATNWLVQSMIPTSDIFFDIMDCRYQKPLPAVHVGESIYLRLIDSARDITDDKDAAEIQLSSASGTNQTLSLMETFAHSGIFKGICQLIYSGDKNKAVETGSLPVRYGDTILARYKSTGNAEPQERTVLVYKGADGQVMPFTKRFKDPDIAVQTQFTIAEAYFELAKKHRELAQESLARREIAQGKKLLDEAIRDYPNTEAQAQADYLLAELSLEFANEAVNEDEKKKFYTEAISRFSDIVASYPDSPHAPKAQYKKALVFEKTGQIDQACEEYVKLSYRYPDNELVAETIARLGQYFLAKGKALVDKINAEANLVEREKLKMQAREMNRTAAQVFGRLAVRFPDHRLAGKTTVLSAQCYMRAEDMDEAIGVFKKVIESKKAEGDLIAQSMYWCGDCYMKKMDYTNAYRMFKKVTWDYPESTWAKYARGRLTEETLAAVETKDMAGGDGR